MTIGSGGRAYASDLWYPGDKSQHCQSCFCPFTPPPLLGNATTTATSNLKCRNQILITGQDIQSLHILSPVYFSILNVSVVPLFVSWISWANFHAKTFWQLAHLSAKPRVYLHIVQLLVPAINSFYCTWEDGCSLMIENINSKSDFKSLNLKFNIY